ncbi:PREDICTED: F-box protein At1g31080-like [Camelina sativa]|uniref:F-box protein At1g31080-like n=1 Tax=Camelina sativa TaxID=90675 RepID=A0ABM0X503_CAMSA|nr:PREDICTED: F-box protein At1g31080-like [Camelina sativa]
MNREETSNSIPNDLILAILSRLPSKSIGRFRCVSKLWRSMLHKPYFTKLFLTRSSTRPRLLVGLRQDHEWSFFSVPQPQNHYGKSSLVVAADFHMKYNRVDNKMARYILTLGSENERWRKIECPLNEDDNGGRSNDVFINGILYYIAYDPEDRLHLIGCFDVRSEKFKFLTLRGGEYDLCTRMINYKGKLAVVKWEYDDHDVFPLQLFMWVLEDVEKQEWSKYAYTLRADNKVVQVDYDLSVVGATASGNIVLVKETAYKPFYVFYFNPERNHLLSVEIKGVGKDHDCFKNQAVCAFVDHVEDLEFNFRSTTFINPPEQKHRHMSSRNHHHVRRSREEMGGREMECGEAKRRRDHWSGKEYKRSGRDNERRRHEEMRGHWSGKEYKWRERERDNERRSREEMRDHWSGKEYHWRERERDNERRSRDEMRDHWSSKEYKWRGRDSEIRSREEMRDHWSGKDYNWRGRERDHERRSREEKREGDNERRSREEKRVGMWRGGEKDI